MKTAELKARIHAWLAMQSMLTFRYERRGTRIERQRPRWYQMAWKWLIGFPERWVRARLGCRFSGWTVKVTYGRS